MLVTFLSIPVWAGPNPLLGTCPILLGTRDTGSCLLASISTSSFAGAPGVGKGWMGSAGRAEGKPRAPRPRSGGLHAAFWARTAPPCQPELCSGHEGTWRRPGTLAQALAQGVVAGIFRPRIQISAWGVLAMLQEPSQGN